MTIYEQINNQINDLLGDGFNVHLNNNDFNWNEENLSQNTIGVMQFGDTQIGQINGATSSTKAMRCVFAVQTLNEIRNKKIATINSVMQYLHQQKFTFDNSDYTFYMQGVQDGSKITVNGEDYELVEFTCAILITNSLVMGDLTKLYVTLNNTKTELLGAFNIVYSLKRNVTAVQTMNNETIKAKNEGFTIGLTFDMQIIKNDELQKDLISNLKQHKTYHVFYEDSITTDELDLFITDYTKQDQRGTWSCAHFVMSEDAEA